MNLSDFAAKWGKHQSSLKEFARIDPRVASITNDPTRVESTLATITWHTITLTSYFDSLVQEFMSDARADIDLRQLVMVVPHGASSAPDFSLVVLDEGYQGPPRSLRIEHGKFVRQDVEQGFRRWHSEIQSAMSRAQLSVADRRSYARMLRLITADFVQEVLLNRELRVILAERPPIQLASVPPAAWRVDTTSGGSTTPSSAGAVVIDDQGRTGVTAAYHAMAGHSTVSVNGVPGTIRSSDPISDSCFVEVPSIAQPFNATNGPLRGVSPRQNESVRFEGISSTGGSTVVRAWSPNLFTSVSSAQRSVYTDDDIIPGDSGAALLDQNDHILGMAHYTTGGPQTTAFSAWIWAESVFDAHKLTPA